jgi:hypothetical protein
MQTKTSAVKAANAEGRAKALGRAAESYRKRIGEERITPFFVQQIEEAFADAATDAALTRAAVVPGSSPVGKGRRSTSKGPRDAKDAAYRLVALILGNPDPHPMDRPEKIYAGLLAYDGRTIKEEQDAAEAEVSEETVNTFASMRLWSEFEWHALERRLEVRMTGVEVGEVAAEECGDCRRFKALAARRGWEVKPCRPCR